MKKLPMIFTVSLPLSIVADLSRYLYQDWEFAKWIGIAVVLDTILGVIKHLLHKDASSESFFSKFGKKIAIYCVAYSLQYSFQLHCTRQCGGSHTMDRHLFMRVHDGA